MSWMNLEPVIQSEVSQKEKDKYHILMHIYRIQKNGTDTDEPICRAGIETQTQRIDLWSQQGEGEIGMNLESSTEVYILPQSQWEFAL